MQHLVGSRSGGASRRSPAPAEVQKTKTTREVGSGRCLEVHSAAHRPQQACLGLHTGLHFPGSLAIGGCHVTEFQPIRCEPIHVLAIFPPDSLPHRSQVAPSDEDSRLKSALDQLPQLQVLLP